MAPTGTVPRQSCTWTNLHHPLEKPAPQGPAHLIHNFCAGYRTCIVENRACQMKARPTLLAGAAQAARLTILSPSINLRLRVIRRSRPSLASRLKPYYKTSVTPAREAFASNWINFHHTLKSPAPQGLPAVIHILCVHCRTSIVENMRAPRGIRRSTGRAPPCGAGVLAQQPPAKHGSAMDQLSLPRGRLTAGALTAPPTTCAGDASLPPGDCGHGPGC